MKPLVMLSSLVLLVAPGSLIAQTYSSSVDQGAEQPIFSHETGGVISSTQPQVAAARPFSTAATSEGVSSLGPQFQIATNINRQMNLRNSFGFMVWKKWVSFDGYTSHATIDLLSSSTSLDFYPLPGHGLRFSAGILIHNSLPGDAAVRLAPLQGGSFTLNGHTYYSPKYSGQANPDPKGPAPGPVVAFEKLQLRNAALTVTTGWGNIIQRKKKGPWSFPVEAGVALLGSPTVKANWVDGQICDAQFQSCQYAMANAQFQSDLLAQFGPYKNHLDLLKTYPVVSFGVAYSFDPRRNR